MEAGTRELAFAATPGSSVPCPLKGGAQIAHGRCVEWQRDNGCHCEYALVSLRREHDHLYGSPRQELPADAAARHEKLEEVEGLIKRAEALEAARPEVCRNCGRKPGDKAPNGKRVLLMRCQRVDCESVHCTACLNDGTAHPRIPENVRPAAPAKEQSMGASYSQGRKCNREGCKNPVADTSKSGTCTPCKQGYKPGSEASIAKAPKTARTDAALPTAPKATPAPVVHSEPGDVISLLEARKEKLLSEAARIDKAIEVLHGS